MYSLLYIVSSLFYKKIRFYFRIKKPCHPCTITKRNGTRMTRLFEHGYLADF